jgi:hypothetical protein
VAGFLGGVLALIVGMAAIGVAAAFMLYLYPLFPWPLRFLAAFQALILGGGLVGACAWVLAEDFRSSEPRYLIALLATFLVLWMYNGLLLHLADAWGLELDGFTSWVLSVPQVSMDAAFGLLRAVFDYVGGFFGALAAALGGDNFILPDFPDFPEVKPTRFTRPSPPLAGEQDLGPVMSWAVESVWSILLGVASGGIGYLLFRSNRA